MPYVVTFLDYTPPARADAIPWTTARIEEAPAETGTWVQIDSKTLTPTDTNPAQPQQRSFTTELATLLEGWYRIIWVDGTGDVSQPTAPIHNAILGAAQYMPSVRDVARLIRARTRTTGGVYLGTFSSATIPTYDQVLDQIPDSAAEVQSDVGVDLRESVWPMAAPVIALHAAMAIESAYFPEQIGVGGTSGPGSNYDALERRYLRALKALIAAVKQAAEGSEPGIADDTGGPFHSFPPDTPGEGLIGWSTRW